MNRPFRHDALLVWRETIAALAGWSDRVLVTFGAALVLTAMRHASDGMATLPVRAAALLIGGWIGFGVGHVVEERLAQHRNAYLFAEEVLTRAGAWRYRLAVLAVAAAGTGGMAAIVDVRAELAALAGLAAGFLAAVAGGTLTLRVGAVRSVGRRWRACIAAAIVIAVAALPLWWAGAPTWIVVVPVLVVAAVTAPDDAEAARFEAIVGRSAGATIRTLASMTAWTGAVALAAMLGHGLAAGAIAAAAAVAAVWFGALRVLAWRWVGRRSGEMIVLAAVAASAIVGAMAMVLAPVALLAATAWLWRRSQAATWLIA